MDPAPTLERGYAMPLQRLTQAGLLLAGLFTGATGPVYGALALTLAEALLGYEAAVVAQVWRLALRPLLGADERRGPLAVHGESMLLFDRRAQRAACGICAACLALALVLIDAAGANWGWALTLFPTASFLLSATTGFCLGCQVYVVGKAIAARLGKGRA